MLDDPPAFSPEIIDQLVKDTMPLGYIVWDMYGNGIDCSPRLVHLFGLKTPQEVFDNWNNLSPPSQPPGYPTESYFEKIFSHAQPRETLVSKWQHTTSDGKPLPVEATCFRQTSGGNDLIIAYLRDLGELNQSQRDSTIGRLHFDSILRSCPICCALLSGDIFTFITPFMENFLGVKVGDSFSSLIIGPKAAEKLCQEPQEEGIGVSWTPVTIRSLHGDIKEMLAYTLCFDETDGSEKKIIWMVDITQSLYIEQELKSAREFAEANAKAKSAFLANMSHEIRTPMNAIIGLTHLALLTSLTEQQKEYIETVQHSGYILLHLINDILDFSKIEAGHLVLEYREFSIGSTISDIAAIIGIRIQEKNLKLQIKVDQQLPPTVMGDSVRLHQVILNLLANAVKFTENGEICLNVEVVEADFLSLVVRFSVTDSGIGMTPLQIKGLFKPFAQATASTTRKFGGSGLGLAISKQIVELMHGEISCQSEQGKGSTFTFTARFGIPLDGEIVNVDESTEVRTDALLVGDNPQDQEKMQHYIELLRAKVYRSGAELTEFKEILDSDAIRNVDFIVFDFSDVRKGFIPAFAALQEKCLDTEPVCVFTENPELETVLDELGIKDSALTLKKPITADDLFDVVAKVAAYKEALKQQKRAITSQVSSRIQDDVVIPKSIRGAKILLVEDNKINQMVAKELLRLEGFETTVADNGLIAIEFLQKQKFDLVLMDIQMPEMDGFEATRTIRSDERFQNLPILAMTANAMAGDRELSLEAGMNDHISKPIDPDTLYRALVKWLRKGV